MTTQPRNATLHFDGAITVNPGGVMRYGWHLDADGGARVAESSGTVGGYPDAERSCNTAEFEALLAGLEWLAAFRLFPFDTLTVVGDSQLVVYALDGRRKVKKPHLKRLADRCRETAAMIAAERIEWKWVPRERNREADRLSKANPTP